MIMKNNAASVKARLLKKAKESGRPFDELLQHFGLERFLYRLSQSEHRDRFILKGALTLRVWNAPMSRPTRDIDLLGRVNNSIEHIENLIRRICDIAAPDDGIVYDSKTVKGVRIKEDADYEGVRIKFTGFLERTKIPMQIDIGFGDVIHPAAVDHDYPAMLDFASARMKVYPRESVVAEKFEALVFLGRLNSRLKDFFDLWLLARNFDFRGLTLAIAIKKTFAHRQTDVTANPFGLSDDFASDPATVAKYRGFVRKGLKDIAPDDFTEIVNVLRDFLLPPAEALLAGERFNKSWTARGPWK